MKTLGRALGSAVLLILALAFTRARASMVLQEETSEQTSQSVQPGSEMPTAPPPPPPTSIPPPPSGSPDVFSEQASGEPAPADALADGAVQQTPPLGQWVYTSQYGWVWMPYGSDYTYVPTDGSSPDMYIYYPSIGWSWVIAPWIWGWGPMPYFGVYGPERYVWWGQGYGHWYGFRPGYAGWTGRGYWAGGQWYGFRSAYPAPPRVGYSSAPGPVAAPPRPGYGSTAHGAYVAPGFGGHGGGGAGHGGGGHH